MAAKPSFGKLQQLQRSEHTTDLLSGEEDHVLVQVQSGESVLEELKAKLREQAEAERKAGLENQNLVQLTGAEEEEEESED